MCQFIETMLVEQNKIVNLSYHNNRLNRTLKYFGATHTDWQIEDFIYPEIERLKSNNPERTLNQYKARLLYDMEHIIDIRLEPYTMRTVNTLRCITTDEMDYSYKYANRNALNKLFAQRGTDNDILIVRNGFITDTSIANVALWDGTYWYTPKTPLLKGTRRESLLDQQLIQEADITLQDLKDFKKIRLFNAMIDWNRLELSIDQLHIV